LAKVEHNSKHYTMRANGSVITPANDLNRALLEGEAHAITGEVNQSPSS
jgi:hypothetical protein